VAVLELTIFLATVARTISTRRGANADNMAAAMGCSQRTVLRVIALLRELGAPLVTEPNGYRFSKPWSLEQAGERLSLSRNVEHCIFCGQAFANEANENLAPGIVRSNLATDSRRAYEARRRPSCQRAATPRLRIPH